MCLDKAYFISESPVKKQPKVGENQSHQDESLPGVTSTDQSRAKTKPGECTGGSNENALKPRPQVSELLSLSIQNSFISKVKSLNERHF